MGRNNVAFKCTYNDGINLAEEPKGAGFYGRCSGENIINNIRSGRVWCSQPENPCRQYFDSGFRNSNIPGLAFPCNESVLLRDFSFDSGTYHHGDRAGEPQYMRQTRPENITILTTRALRGTQFDWFVFGFVYIDDVEDDKVIHGNKDLSVILSPEEWLPFWAFKPLDGKQKWASGLFRYLSDESVFRILEAIYYVVQGPRDKEIAEAHLEEYSRRTGIDWPRERPHYLEKILSGTWFTRKYGSGGESPAHRRLKRHVYKHPESIDLKKVKESYLEYGFATADSVDVAFELESGSWAVIEIELEGEQNNYCGFLQAIKYRSLMEAEKRKPLGQGVTAFLVAHHIPKSIKDLAAHYGVKCIEISQEEMNG